MNKYLKNFFIKVKENSTIVDIVLSIVVGCIYSISSEYIKNTEIVISIQIVLNCIFTSLGFYVFSILSRIGISSLLKYNNKKSWLFDNDKFFIYKIGLIILICWIPILCMLYPGTLINDSWGQLQQVMIQRHGEYNIGSHHPIIDTFFMAVIILPLAVKASKWHLAFFVYVVLQAVFTSLTLAYTLKYAKNKLKLNNRFLLIFMIIYCVVPIIPLSVQTISKDALSAWIYVLFIVKFIELIRTKGESLKDKKELISLVFITILCTLTKKVELYVVLISLFICLFISKGCRKQIVLVILINIVLMYLVMPMVYFTFSIKKSGKQEMLSIPFQQTALYVITYPDEVTDEEKDVISKVLEYDKLKEQYHADNADYVKGYTPRADNKAYSEYTKTWIKMFFKHPGVYFKAFYSMIAGWFSNFEYKPLTNMNHHSQLNASIIPEDTWKRKELFENTTNVVDKIYDTLYNIPIIGVVFTYGFYCFMMPIYFITYWLIEYIKKNNKVKWSWVAVIPMVLSLALGCFLAPVSTHIEGRRYLYPITYTIIVTLMWCIYVKKYNLNEKGDSNEK